MFCSFKQEPCLSKQETAAFGRAAFALLCSLCALLFGVSACGGNATWKKDDLERFYEVPLVAVVNTARPAIEIAVDQQGPILVAVDSALEGMVISRDAARALQLPGANRIESSGQLTARSVQIGDLELTDVVMAVTDRNDLGTVAGRRIQGVIGNVLFPGERAIELNPELGVLRLWQKETPEEKSLRLHQAQCLQKGHGATIEVEVEGQKRYFTLSTNARSAIDRSTASELCLESTQNGYYALLAFEGFPQHLEHLGVYSGPGDGILGYNHLSTRRLFIQQDQSYIYPPSSQPKMAYLSRFGDLGCGKNFELCLKGVVVDRGDGFVELEIEKPSQIIAPRYGLRVDFGRETAKTALIALDPGKAVRTLRARIEEPSITARNTRAIGQEVTVVDVVVLANDCSGDLCIR